MYTILSQNILFTIYVQKTKGEFDWSAQEQGFLLGAFFYGFIITLIPGGYLSERFGPKWVLFWSIFGGVLCTFLSPVTARYGGFTGFMILKIIQGLLQVSQIFYLVNIWYLILNSQGPTFSGTMSILSKWVPPSERSVSATIGKTLVHCISPGGQQPLATYFIVT